MNNLDFDTIKSIDENASAHLAKFPGAKNFFSLNNIKELEKKPSNTFNYRVKGDIGVLDQAQSGRCWLFASLGMLRIALIKKYKLSSNFKLSANYLNFWGLLEKTNTFLHRIYETRDKPLKDRHVQYILNESVYEGGNWSFSSQLIIKYGIIPSSIMPETWASRNSKKFLLFLTMKLGIFAKEIREKKQNNRIPEYLQEVYEILVLFLGNPPIPNQRITWDFESITPKTQEKSRKKTQKKQQNSKNLKFESFCGTPLELYKTCNEDLEDRVLLTNMPNLAKNQKYKFMYECEILGNTDSMLNVDSQIFSEMAKSSIVNRNEAVWTGVNFDQYFGGSYLSSPQINQIFPFNLEMNKRDTIMYQMPPINHAMLIRAVHVHNGKPIRWLIHNSHGSDTGMSGELIVTDEWFEKNVYEIVIHRNLLPNSLVDIYDNRQTTTLLPWEWNLPDHNYN